MRTIQPEGNARNRNTPKTIIPKTTNTQNTSNPEEVMFNNASQTGIVRRYFEIATVDYDVSNLINQYDADHNGSLSYQETANAYGENHLRDNGTSHILLNYFHMMDANHNGELTLEEVRDVARLTTNNGEMDGEGLYSTAEDLRQLDHNTGHDGYFEHSGSYGFYRIYGNRR